MPLGQEVPLGPPVGIICCADAGLVSSTREKVRAAPTKTPREGLIVACKRGHSQSYPLDAAGVNWGLTGAPVALWMLVEAERRNNQCTSVKTLFPSDILKYKFDKSAPAL